MGDKFENIHGSTINNRNNINTESGKRLQNKQKKNSKLNVFLEYIASNKLSECIAELKDYLKTDQNNNNLLKVVVLNSAQLFHINEQLDSHLISDEDYSIGRGKINKNILEVINKIK